MKYVDRQDITSENRKEYEALVAIFHQLQKKRKNASNTDLMVEINHIISEYVEVDVPQEVLYHLVDLISVKLILLCCKKSLQERKKEI